MTHTCCTWVWDEIIHDFVCNNCGSSHDMLRREYEQIKLKKKMEFAYNPENGPLEQQWERQQTQDWDDMKAETL